MYTTPRHKVFISFHHADQVYKEHFSLMMGNDIVDESVGDGDIDDESLSTDRIRQIIRDDFIRDATVTVGVPPKLIIFNGFLVGAGAQHCQGQIRQRDRFATTMTIPTRNGDFGVTRAGSEWPARRAHSTACPNA